MKKLTSYSQYFIHSFVIICGIIGVIGGLLKSLEFPSESYYCLIILIIISLFFYYLYNNKNKKIGLIVVVSEILLCTYLFMLRSIEMNTLIRQLEYVAKYDFYLKVSEVLKNSVITDFIFIYALIIFISLPFIYLIVSVIAKKKSVFIKLLLLMFAFILPVIIKHPLIDISGYTFTIFLVYSFVFSFLINKRENEVTHQIVVIGIIIPTLLFSSVFLEGNPVFKSNSLDVIFKISSWIEENQWNQLFNTQNSTGASASINGALPNGSVTIDGRAALKVKSTQPFSSYLRSYSLGYYTNNRWQPVMNEFEGQKNNSLLNVSVNEDSENSATVQIETERQTKYQIVPYYPLSPNELIDDSYYKKNDEPMSVNYTKNIVFTIWTNPNIVVPNDTEYYNYVLKEYMNVPDNLKPKFKQLVDKIKLWHNTDISQGFVEEKATYVSQILNEYTNYDLNSGPLPAGKDFVEYFLFENQKGSCTHYASTATLLLRYLGVPSRYVTGFVMTTSDFDKNKEAIIKNNRAHAWVEIYMQGIGWVPYDFTKSAYMGSETTEISMADRLDELLRIQNESNLAPVTPERKPLNPLELDPRQDDTPQEETDIEVDKVPWYDSIIQYSQYLYIVGGVILVFVVYRYGQKTYMTLKIKKAENNKKIILIYQRMLLIDKEKNYISQSVLDIAYKAKFSQHLIDIDEVNIVEKELKSLQKTIYQTLPWYKKILYKYILGYM